MNYKLFKLKALGFSMFCIILNANAEPTFESPQALLGVNGPVETWGVSSADVNNDYCPDLFFGNHRGQPSLYLGNCDGTFTSKPDFIDGDNIYVDDHTTVFGDFNNDGCPDMHMSVGGTNPAIENDKNQFLLGELVSGSCTGKFIRNNSTPTIGSATEYPEQRARSSVPFDANFDGDLDLATTGYDGDSQSTGGLEQIFENNGSAVFTQQGSQYGFDGHTKTLFNIFSNIVGDDELDLICGESQFPRQECTKDVSSAPFVSNLLELLDPAKYNTVDAFAEDIDNDGDTDLVALRRKSVSGNAKRYNNNTVVEGINTTNTTSGIRCLGIPGDVDITSFAITGDYIDSNDIKFGSGNYNVSPPQPSSIGGSARRYVFTGLVRSNPQYEGLSLPDDSDGINENERGTYVGYLEAENMWKVCDASGTTDPVGTPPKRKFNKYGMRIEFSGPVEELIHENYDPSTEPITPVVWINNGKNGLDQTIFENKSTESGITGPVTAFGLGKGDFDNDGDMDFVASYENHGVRGNNYLYTNDGNGVFQRTRFTSCPNGVAESVAVIDANADGLLDPVMGCAWYGLAHSTTYEHTLWLNDTSNSNKAIMFNVVGVSVNHGGIGARIKVTDANDRTNVICARDVGNTFGRGSQDSEFVHCGVATHSTVDVIIDWPGSAGGQDIYDDISTAAMYELTQGANVPTLIKTLLNSTNTDPVLSFQSKSVPETDTDDPRFIAIVADQDILVGTQFTVNYKTTPGTANNSGEDDYISVDLTTTVTAQGTSGQNVPAGTPLKHIPVTILGDDEFEPDETFSIEIVSVVSGATPGLPATVTILNDDDEPVSAVPVLTVFDKNVSEGSPNGDIAYIKVTSDIELETDLVINYKTKVGIGPTGASSSDFVWTNSSVTMVTGTDTKFIPVTIINDADGPPEDSLNETFTIEFTLNDPADASFNLGDNIATVTIADDDQ